MHLRHKKPLNPYKGQANNDKNVPVGFIGGIQWRWFQTAGFPTQKSNKRHQFRLPTLPQNKSPSMPNFWPSLLRPPMRVYLGLQQTTGSIGYATTSRMNSTRRLCSLNPWSTNRTSNPTTWPSSRNKLNIRNKSRSYKPNGKSGKKANQTKIATKRKTPSLLRSPPEIIRISLLKDRCKMQSISPKIVLCLENLMKIILKIVKHN